MAAPAGVDDTAPVEEDEPEAGDDDTEDQLDEYPRDFYADALDDA